MLSGSVCQELKASTHAAVLQDCVANNRWVCDMLTEDC